MLNNNDNKSIVPVSDNIFSKIKKFFKGIFGQQTDYSYEMNVEQNINESKGSIKNSVFTDTIKVEEDMNQRLIKLQRLIREKRITENELSNEDKTELKKLYKAQINELRTSILQKRNRIMEIKYEKKRKAHARI